MEHIAKKRMTPMVTERKNIQSAVATGVKGSFAEKAVDLRGSVSGPRDLSTNPKYLSPKKR